ncbi:hypothetical protein GN956_G2745 [Arapaima gigas]
MFTGEGNSVSKYQTDYKTGKIVMVTVDKTPVRDDLQQSFWLLSAEHCPEGVGLSFCGPLEVTTPRRHTPGRNR